MTITDNPTDLNIRRVAGRIGAEISGVRLGPDQPAAEIEAIRNLIVANKVVFFRGQHHLDEAGQVGFAARLGTVTTAHPTVPGYAENADVLDLDSGRGGRANHWHTDVTFVDRFPAFSILRAVTIPSHGGDTVWANTAAAYESLEPELQDLADRLWAIHNNEFDYARLGGDADGPDPTRVEYARIFASTKYETVHPVVHIHPESGERAFLLGGFVRSIVGLSQSDSAALFRVFQDRVTTLENTVRWPWQEGDVAIWDNRATQHYAVADYGDQRRTMRRVTVAGSVPISVDGRTSRSRSGDASAYNRIG